MPPIHLALTTDSAGVSLADLAPVAAAIQKQITRDFAPLWKVDATIDALPIDNIPDGYWRIILADDTGGPDEGVHKTSDGTPYALVRPGPTWSLTASHEALEMLADPTFGNLIAGASPKPGQGRVRFLVEVCDPCQDGKYAYPVNGVTVSDFYTPNYFDPVTNAATRYSFCGKIRAPRTVLPNGYLTWLMDDNRVWQAQADAAGKVEFIDRGFLSLDSGLALRERIDALTPNRQAPLSNATLPAAHRAAIAAARAAATAGAARFQAELAALKARPAARKKIRLRRNSP